MFVEKPTIIIDIAVRSLVLLVYFAGLYSNVSISDYIAKERRSEFTRRLDVENSYVEVVKSVFEAVKVYNSNANEYNQLISSKKVSLVAKELSHAMAYDQTSIQMITDYAKIHTEKMKLLTLLDEEIKKLDFDEIIEKTELATKIIKRLQLVKRSEDMINAVFTNQSTPEFRYNISSSLNDNISQIIVLSEIYVALRSDKSTHKALNHIRATELIVNEFSDFFNKDLILRFTKYSSEIERAYNL